MRNSFRLQQWPSAKYDLSDNILSTHPLFSFLEDFLYSLARLSNDVISNA
jgi:hypothetical protein